MNEISWRGSMRDGHGWRRLDLLDCSGRGSSADDFKRGYGRSVPGFLWVPGFLSVPPTAFV